MASAVDNPVKQQLVDKLPKRFRGIKFGIQSNQHVANQAVIEVSNRLLYDIEKNRSAYPHGPLDSRLVSLYSHSLTDPTSSSITICANATVTLYRASRANKASATHARNRSPTALATLAT
jgi:hypothetical protein